MEAGGGSQRWGKIHAQVLFDSILPWFPVLNLLSSPLLMMHDVALPASAFASALVGQRLPSLVLLWCPFCWLLQSTERQFVLCDALPGLRCRIGGVFVCVLQFALLKPFSPNASKGSDQFMSLNMGLNRGNVTKAFAPRPRFLVVLVLWLQGGTQRHQALLVFCRCWWEWPWGN